MEADKTHQLSALLACRSREDLERIRGMDSSSFSFITLTCKHNRADLLKLLLKDDTSDDAVVPRWCSVGAEYEGHNAVYFAIRSDNVEILRTLLGSVTSELSERLVSESYKELLLNHVLLSKEMHLFVQYTLLDLRFFSKDDVAVLPVTSIADIQERIQLLIENIADINTYAEVDSHFLYTAKFIAQNIHILKHQLKSTYNILPWEEMEFCLVSFVSAHIRRQELNLFYLSVLRRERLLKDLDEFASALQGLEEHILSTDIRELQEKLVFDREEVTSAISSRYPHLYADYKEVRDISSLHIIKSYLDAALLADSATRLGQLTIKRALQVTGEHLKNTLDSPKLSLAVGDRLLLSAPKETREVLQDLCNTLSHPHLDLKDSVLYLNIQNDIKKIASVITDITYSKIMDKVRCMLTRLIDSDSVDEFQEVANVFRDVCIAKVQETDTVTKGHRKLEDFIGDIIKNIVDPTPYEKKLFAEIKDVLDKSKTQRNLKTEDFSFLKAIVRLSSAFDFNIKQNNVNSMRAMKFAASKALKIFSSQENPLEIGRHYLLGGLLSKFYNSVSTRIKPEIVIELKFAIARIYFSGSIDKGEINCIDEYGRQLFLSDFNKNENGEEKCISVENSDEVLSKQLSLTLTELKNTVGTDRMCGQLYEHLSTLHKDETTNRFMVEGLVLDTMSLLDSSKRVPNNELYLDGDIPLLSGKCLRNHLVHGNALVDILPTDAWSSVLLNAVKLTESKDLLLNCKIGNVLNHDIIQLRRRYELGFSILDKQKEMWKSLLDGNFEKFTLLIEGGADICARNRDLSSTLHYAVRGPNIEIVKFLTKQEIINTETRDVDGQIALHVAATYGRDLIVNFLVTEKRNSVNQVDDSGKTPLHLASHNGHKKTVLTLLSLGAKTTNKDNSGYSPLHYAVANNYLDIVKILLEKDANVDENTITGGFTALHSAADLGHVAIVQYLLLKGADVNAKTIQGTLPLHLAAFNGHQGVVNSLLEKGAHVNLTESKGLSSLYFAVENNQKETVKILLEKGAFVNNGDMTYNNTPFHTAVSNGNAFIVDLLLQHNANVNAKRNDGLTPLLLAAGGGHAHLVDLLLENGAHANRRDATGSTALHIAADLGHTSVVNTLIQRGIDIHILNTGKETALHLAALKGHQEVVNILLAAGANVHSIDKDGSTALHLSAGNGHEEISEALIKKMAKIKCRNTRNRTPLHEAATKTCNEKIIKILLKYGADVNEIDELGGTALHLASFAGNSSVVEALLQGKAEVDAQAEGGFTALHLAVMGNHKAVVEVLLKYGASVNHLDSTGASVLCRAAESNNKVLLDILIAKGADVNIGGGQLLLSAVRAGHRLIVEVLLENKDVNINITDQDGDNLLYTAALSGDAFIAKALIKRGFKVADCKQDPSPLSIAISLGHTEFVDVMLEHGANVNPADPNLSPLFFAVHMNKPDIVEKLLHWGANPDIRDSEGRTLLELAVANSQIPNILILLQQKCARINAKGSDTWSLLHIAAHAGNLEVTKLLVDRGADVNARNKVGSKPIHIAARENHHHILDFFLELGMSIDDQGSAGYTMMHYAALGGHLPVAQYLIDKHVDINYPALNGSLPIHCSAELGHTEMVKLLLHSGAVYNAMDNFGSTPSDSSTSQDIKDVLESIGKLFKAVKKNDVAMVGNLVKDLANYLDAKSSDFSTLLHIASWKGFQETCDILLESKANPNAVGMTGNSPLHYASKYSHPGIVKSLLKNGAAYNLKADNMKTPLDFAKQKDIKSLLQIIALSFKKVRTRDVSVIKDINKIKDVDVIETVMKARDTDGNTLVVVAMKCGFPDIDELKQVSQVNAPDILSLVDSMLMLERFTEAIDILKHLLNERTEILGEDNPGTLDVKYKLALVLYKQCKYFEAMPMLEDIYRKRVQAFGPYNPVSLETRSTMALLLHRLGRNDEAWDIFQELLPRQEDVLGEGHEQLMQTKTHAGMVLHVLGKHEEALRLYTDVYKRHKKSFGAQHPDTLRLQNNIAMVFHSQGKPDEAFSMYKTVYEARKTILGLNHSETIRARRNMATVLMDVHKLDEALEIFQETLAIQKNVFGLNHSDTVYTQSLIKSLYLRQRNLPEALKIHKEGLSARKATMGSNHPDFAKLDGILDSVDENLNLQFDVDVGSVAPCDVNLLNASSVGDRRKVHSLIKNGSDVNTADGEGRTALHFAATVEVTELLLNSGADATAMSQAGNTPLHLATSRACEKTVRLLLQNVKTTKPNAYHKFINAKTAVGGSTALHVAAKKGTTDVVVCLLAHGVCYNSRDRSDNRTPLQCSGSPYVTRLLNLAEKVFEMARRGGTVLPQGNEKHLAAVMNSRDTDRRTPLQLATVHGHTATARIFTALLKTQN